MLPQEHIQELLSVSHVQAVANSAGLNIAVEQRDFGVDGTFRRISIRENRRFSSGYALDFQLKASTLCKVESQDIVYDLEVKTYNDLIGRWTEGSPIPCILILKVLPKDSDLWISVSEEELLLSGGCFWAYLQGEPSSNKSKVRIRIPREQLFTPDSLSTLFNRFVVNPWKVNYGQYSTDAPP